MPTFVIGQLITLVGKTLHGKNRVHEQGSQWVVDSIAGEGFSLTANSVLLSSKTIDPRDKRPFLRWVMPNDKDFEVIP
jgi:hypothetical protein